MKHLLNNLSEEEKNSIREQHTDKLKIDTSKFSKLMESKLGDVKLLNEQPLGSNQDIAKNMEEIKKCVQENSGNVPFFKMTIDSMDSKFNMLMNLFTSALTNQKFDVNKETAIISACLRRKGLDPATIAKQVGLPGVNLK